MCIVCSGMIPHGIRSTAAMHLFREASRLRGTAFRSSIPTRPSTTTPRAVRPGFTWCLESRLLERRAFMWDKSIRMAS